MSEYIVSARKYRPTTFDSVVGQEAIATTLKNAIRTGKLAHAYLFCGPRGVGKTTCARIFAKTINCLNPQADGEACNQCESCQAFNEGRSMNIHELDAASNNSVDDIRQLIEQVRIPPQIGKYKVFIIDEVHMLSASAFNAFLKTLEEPPAHAIFILATTEKHKILPTILSRCQIYDFQRMSVQNTIRHLEHVAQQEGYTYEPAALNVIAQKADGGMRDALSIFDQVVSFTGGNITYQQVIRNLNVLDYDYYFRLVDLMLQKKVTECLLLFNDVLGKGFEGGPFISGLASHLRDVLVSKDPQTASLLEVTDDIRQRYVAQAQHCKTTWLYSAIRLCNNCDQAYRNSRNKRLQIELTLIECAQLDDDDPAAGRRPIRKLKPIFAHLTAAGTPAAAAGVAQPQQPAHTTAQPTVPTSRPVTHAAPVSERPSAPSSAPSAPQAASPRSFKLGTLGGPSIFHKNAVPSAETAPQPIQAEPTPVSLSSGQDKPVQQDALLVSWQRFINTLPREETAMAQRMRIMQPQLHDSHTAYVIAENTVVAQRLQAMLDAILRFLRTDLQNSQFELHVRVPERQGQTHVLDKRSQLRHLCDLNPSLITLGKTFKLELQ